MAANIWLVIEVVRPFIDFHEVKGILVFVGVLVGSLIYLLFLVYLAYLPLIEEEKATEDIVAAVVKEEKEIISSSTPLLSEDPTTTTITEGTHIEIVTRSLKGEETEQVTM
eukprot:TRINITY_DN4387_c0_g1_i2.p1 TRINITY_DN4387_c0_g1~~TRINITY_DN4387_c0_g1_i2.p1  ORF type:complete len:111 (-),score=33.30 TRINITY_DN4387_c0_g1_i2:83-415(-)